MRLLISFFCIGLATACTQFPELDNTVSPDVEDLPYPTLKPQEDLLNSAKPSDVDEEELREELARRGADLKTRAQSIGSTGEF